MKKVRMGENPLFDALEEKQTPETGADAGDQAGKKNAAEAGLKPEYTRATYILKKESVRKVQAMAYWERMSIIETMDTILEHAVMTYEKKHGTLKPIPKDRKKVL